jgi:hypothetical protein
MTSITNKNVQEHTVCGETVEEVLDTAMDELKQGKINGEKIIHAYLMRDYDYAEDREIWSMKIMVSTYANKK